MPTYEYVCTKCGHHLETFQSMKDAPLKRCPHCKKQGLRRLIGGGAGFIFKGTGFYETDYKRPPVKAGEVKSDTGKTEAAKPAADKPAASSSPASESKAAAK